MQRVLLSEDFAERLAERPLADASIADEYERDLGLLAGVLHAPSNPVDDVLVNCLIKVGQHLADMPAQQAPIPLLGLDAPSGPWIQPTFDNRRTGRTKYHAAILPPPAMREPPLAEGRGLFGAGVDEAIEIKVAEIIEAQKRRHPIDVALAPGTVFDFLEAQHHGSGPIEHHAIFGVKLGEQLRSLGLGLGCRLRCRLCLCAFCFLVGLITRSL